MNLPDSNNAGVYTDFQGFNALRAQASKDAKGTLPVVAKQFEALFVQTLMKGLRATTNGDPMLGNAGKMYQELFDQQIALELSQAGGIGLAAVIERQLTGVSPTSVVATPSAEKSEAAPLQRSAIRTVQPKIGVPQAPTVMGTARVPELKFSGSPSEFVEAMMPHAARAAETLGIDAKVLVAQAALETGWGKSVIRDKVGDSSFNLFGIKADKRWDGPKVEVATLEYEQGVLIRVNAPFRKYTSVEESFADYAQFIKSQPRYENLLKTGTTNAQYVQGLQSAGYATDPQYAKKIMDVFRRIETDVSAQGI